MTTDLDAAVTALTQPTETLVQVGDEWVKVKHEPLLTQLEEAVTSAIGNGGGGGTATGSVLNSEALYHVTRFLSMVGDWCRMAGVRPARDAVSDLTAWSIVFQGDGAWYAGELVKWARTIRDLLDPPKRVPLADPCTVCKAATFTDPEGVVSRPVVVEYDQADPMRTARARCRACDAEWVGADAIEELVEELSGPNTHDSGGDRG